MVIHLEDAFVTDRTVVRSGWLWLDAFFADTHSLRNKAALWRITRRHGYTHVIMEADINQQPVSNQQQNYRHRRTPIPPPG